MEKRDGSWLLCDGDELSVDDACAVATDGGTGFQITDTADAQVRYFDPQTGENYELRYDDETGRLCLVDPAKYEADVQAAGGG
jgi:hypothetical protein